MTDSVLIIENDPSTVELLSVVFQREGFTVYSALDGAEGARAPLLQRGGRRDVELDGRYAECRLGSRTGIAHRQGSPNSVRASGA